ncbi:MAG: hypothetical protein PQJ59_02315 [Spirochaetales bacterium]|nr:hypothetical protein [Spirochaetales bacterium]
MIKKAPFLLSLLLILTVCTTTETSRVVSAPSQDDSWKAVFRGEEIFILTQGTVAVGLIDTLNREIPEARWTARFDYNGDVSSNYLVLDYRDEASGTPIGPVVTKMFSGFPLDGTTQVNSNRIRLAYFQEESYEGWTDSLQTQLKAYGDLIKNSTIEKTRGAWYTDPLTAYLKETVDKRTDQTFLTAVNYTTGEEKQLLRYELVRQNVSDEIEWIVRIYDLCGEIEWVSGLVSADVRAGENLTGFYGAIEEGVMTFTGFSPLTWSQSDLKLGQADVEFRNDQMITWVEGRSMRRAYPNDSGKLRISGTEKGFMIHGYDFSGNTFPLMLLSPDYSMNRVHVETFQKIRNLELPLVFNETESSEGVARSYTFHDLRANYTEELYLPVRNLESVRIAPTEADRGFIDLYDGRFFGLDEVLEDPVIAEKDSLQLFSNGLPFGNLEFVDELVTFYPELEVYKAESDLIFSEEGESDYFVTIHTSPMEPGVTYQVSIRSHPTLFEQDFLWEFTAR